MADTLSQIQEAFINQWGVLGAQWGVTKTMGQIQALLMVSEEPLTTDDMMTRLQISRGNAHGGIKDLVNWGLAQKVIVKGDRKDYYTAEKDPWQIFFIVARERRRREIEPLLKLLHEVQSESAPLRSNQGKAFHHQMNELVDFVELGDAALKTVANAERSRLSRWLLNLIRARGKSKQ